MAASAARCFGGELRVHAILGRNGHQETAMDDVIRDTLHLIRQRIEQLHGERGDDDDFQEGLKSAVCGIERALGAVGDGSAGTPHTEDAIGGIEGSLAELHIRLVMRGEAWVDDPAMRAKLPLADHLLAQACALLIED
jgi:hypothetical protein